MRCVATGGACMLLLCAFVSAGAYAQGTTPSGDGDYEDRLIDGGNLAPDFADDIGGGGDPEGWPRAFRMQLATSRLTRNDRQINESGIRLGGMLDTPNYGAFTLDANLRSSNSDLIGSGGLVSLWQRGLPMNGGWFANNALGVFNSPSIDLARQQYRFFIPTIPTVGAATEWRQAGGLQFQTSVGQPGLFTGLYTPTFEGLGGRAVTGGMQWNLSREWAAAVQAVDVDRARFTLSPTALGATVSARAWYGASAWTTPGARAQLNVVGSELDGGSERTGAWLDGGIRDNLLWHTFGGFRLPSNLVWGNQPLPSNLQGGYYRAAYQSRQWIVDGGVDYVMPVSGGGSGTLYAIGNARYQMLTGLGVGGGANMRQGAGDAWSAFGFVDHANPWGLGRVQANYAKDDFQNNTLLTLDQSWRVPSGARLSTSLLLGRENFEHYSANRYGVAVYGGGQLRSNLSVDINARWDEAFGQASSQNVLANAALNWGISSGWIASASYYENRNTGRLPTRRHLSDPRAVSALPAAERPRRVSLTALRLAGRDPGRAPGWTARNRLGHRRRRALPRCQRQRPARCRRGGCPQRHDPARRPVHRAHRFAGTLRVCFGGRRQARAGHRSGQSAAAVGGPRRRAHRGGGGCPRSNAHRNPRAPTALSDRITGARTRAVATLRTRRPPRRSRG